MPESRESDAIAILSPLCLHAAIIVIELSFFCPVRTTGLFFGRGFLLSCILSFRRRSFLLLLNGLSSIVFLFFLLPPPIIQFVLVYLHTTGRRRPDVPVGHVPQANGLRRLFAPQGKERSDDV